MKMFSWVEEGEVVSNVTCAGGIHVREGVEFTLSAAADETVEINLGLRASDELYPFAEQPLVRDLLSGLAVDLASFFQDDVETLADAADYMLEQLLAQEGSVEVRWHYEGGDRVEPAGINVFFRFKHGNVEIKEKIFIDLERADEYFLLDHSEAD